MVNTEAAFVLVASKLKTTLRRLLLNLRTQVTSMTIHDNLCMCIHKAVLYLSALTPVCNY